MSGASSLTGRKLMPSGSKIAFLLKNMTGWQAFALFKTENALSSGEQF